QTLADACDLFIARDDAAAFSRGDLFVGIKTKDRGMRPATAAYRGPTILGAQGLTGIVDEHQVVSLGQGTKLIEASRVPEGVDGQDGTGFWSDRSLHGLRRNTQRVWIYVHEHRP